MMMLKMKLTAATTTARLSARARLQPQHMASHSQVHLIHFDAASHLFALVHS